MDSPRSGFRRATATSWALAGLGIAGVAGASSLAYADTFKPQATESPVVAIESVPPGMGPTPVQNLPPVPDVVAPTVDAPSALPLDTAASGAPEITPEQAVEQTPIPRQTPATQYTPEQTVEKAPPPATHQTPVPTVKPPSSTRRNLTPTTVLAPNYSPHVTMSRGS